MTSALVKPFDLQLFFSGSKLVSPLFIEKFTNRVAHTDKQRKSYSGDSNHDFQCLDL